MTRAMQPLLPVTDQREPPLSVGVNSCSWRRASRTRSALSVFRRSLGSRCRDGGERLRLRVSLLGFRSWHENRVEVSCRARSGALAPELARHEGSTPRFLLTGPTPVVLSAVFLDGSRRSLGSANFFDRISQSGGFRAEGRKILSYGEVAMTAGLSSVHMNVSLVM